MAWAARFLSEILSEFLSEWRACLFDEEWDKNHYARLEVYEIPKSGLNTNSVLSCSVCRTVISMKGGGGDNFCIQCVRAILNNPTLRDLIRQESRNPSNL